MQPFSKLFHRTQAVQVAKGSEVVTARVLYFRVPTGILLMPLTCIASDGVIVSKDEFEARNRDATNPEVEAYWALNKCGI